MGKKFLLFAPIFLLLLSFCSQSYELKVVRQVTGPGETNTYLLYEVESKEAALFDVGGSINTLESVIKEKGLELKYIFITHSHPDHVYGVPAVRQKYPHAKLCFSREEWEDTKSYANWEKELTPDMAAGIKAEIERNPQFADMLNFNYDLLGKPDIFLEGNQVFGLGNLMIRTIFAPGHSRGSICFHAGNVLFSGDVLFHRLVGRTDMPTGSPEDIVTTVRRLYKLLPDETRVYPGHGQFTDIGSEKRENKEVSIKSVNLEN